jgi:hypothetical protein
VLRDVPVRCVDVSRHERQFDARHRSHTEAAERLHVAVPAAQQHQVLSTSRCMKLRKLVLLDVIERRKAEEVHSSGSSSKSKSGIVMI